MVEFNAKGFPLTNTHRQYSGNTHISSPVVYELVQINDMILLPKINNILRHALPFV